MENSSLFIAGAGHFIPIIFSRNFPVRGRGVSGPFRFKLAGAWNVGALSESNYCSLLPHPPKPTGRKPAQIRLAIFGALSSRGRLGAPLCFRRLRPILHPADWSPGVPVEVRPDVGAALAAATTDEAGLKV